MTDETETDTEKASTNIPSTGSELKIAQFCRFGSPQYYVVMSRFLYGFPLDDEVKDVDIMTFNDLYDAAVALETPDLRAYTLKKIEEKLVENARNVSSFPEEGSPPPTNDWLDAFVDGLDTLLRTDERDEDTDEMSGLVAVAVQVCCRYYFVIRQYEPFKDLGQQYPRLARDMLDYVAANSGGMMG